MHRLTPQERREVEGAFESIFSRVPAESFDSLAKQSQAEDEEAEAKVNSFVDGLFRRQKGAEANGEEERTSDGSEEEGREE